MNLPFEEGKLFYELYAALLSYVNRQRRIVADQFSGIEEYTSLPAEKRWAIRKVLYQQRELIDQFVKDNPDNLSAKELAIVADWKHALVGNFTVFRYLSKYTIFLRPSEPVKAYGVLALADPLEELIGPYLPRLIETVLLPFKGKIIYDGLFSMHNLSFGGGIKRLLKEDYRRAKKLFGIITSLPEGETKTPIKTDKQAKKTIRSRSGHSTGCKDILEAIVGLSDAFCKDFLNEEYADLCRELAGVLARKRPSPLLRGKLEAWASGIVRTIGRINFLDDPSQKPYLKLSAIDMAFGVSESAGQGKSREIRAMLKIHQLDPAWTLPSRMDDNPLVWILEVNGFLMDIRDAPRDAQIVAYEKGLIPYIPADRVKKNYAVL